MHFVKLIFKRLTFGLLIIITLIIFVAILFAFIHNILTIKEKMEMQIGEVISVSDKKMNAYVTGEGAHTIVLLSGLGTASPIADFMPLAEKLGEENRVVILEYFGYGFSDQTSEPRTNKQIVAEVREALEKLGLKGPYILMPHSISGIYALEYAMTYPEEVEAIIGIDASVPNQTKITSPPKVSGLMGIMNKMGFFRLLDTTNAEMNTGGYYTDVELKLAEYAAKWNSMNFTMIDEFEHVLSNTTLLYDRQYPVDLPILLFLSSDTIKNDDTWLPLHEAMFTEQTAREIQKISILEGGHYLHWYQCERITEATLAFIKNVLD